MKRVRPSFEEILVYIHEHVSNSSIEPSFSSKMLATIDRDKPIWDSRVLIALGI